MKGEKKYCTFILCLFIILTIGTSCTRKVEKNSSLSFNIQKTKTISGKAGVLEKGPLEFIAINIRIPGQDLPIVRTFEKDEIASIGSGIVFDGLPNTSNALVQYLAMFENQTTLAKQFEYGDTNIALKNGDNVAHIIPALSGAATSEGKIAGRYLTGADTGPTGTIVVSYQHENQPPIAVSTTEMYDGWFEVFALAGSSEKLHYQMLNTGEVLFGGSTNVDSLFTTPGSTHLMKVTAPSSFDIKGEEQSAEAHVFGFFTAPGSTIPLESHQACYLDVDEMVPGMFTSQTKTAQIAFNGKSTALTGAINVIGGTQSSKTDFFTTLSDPCVSSATKMPYYHNRIAESRSPFGMNGPFKMIRPFESDSGFVITTPSGPTPGIINKVNLKWKYLEGISAASVDGVEIFAKEHSSTDSNDGDNNHDDNLNCRQQAEADGFSSIKDVSGLVENTDIANVLGQSINSTNHFNFNYIFCPYRSPVLKPRNYWKTSVYVGSSDDGDNHHYGWSVSTGSTTNPTISDYSQIASVNASHFYLCA